jgi:hypothetical protein
MIRLLLTTFLIRWGGWMNGYINNGERMMMNPPPKEEEAKEL